MKESLQVTVSWWLAKESSHREKHKVDLRRERRMKEKGKFGKRRVGETKFEWSIRAYLS